LSEASGVEFLVFRFGFVLASRAKRNVAFMHGEVFPAVATPEQVSHPCILPGGNPRNVVRHGILYAGGTLNLKVAAPGASIAETANSEFTVPLN